MKVLHVNMSLDGITGGGTVERIIQLDKAIQELGCESKVLSIDTHRRGGAMPNNISLLPCISRRWFIPVPNFSLIRKLVKWSDVVHLMNHWTVINICVYLVAKKLGKPYIVCPAGALNIFGRSKFKKFLFQKVIGNSILQNASALIAISPDEIKLFENANVRSDLIHHIPNGVNQRNFSYSDELLFRKKLNIESSPYILFLGRLNLIKGPDILLAAFATCKESIDHHLVFSGPDDGMLEKLKKQAHDLGLQNRVSFSGHVEGELKSSAYHGADVLVIPSRHEAMSIVALEAAISKTAVLLTDQCGFSELADAGAAIEVPATVEGVGKGLHKVLSAEQSTIDEMGSKGYSYVLKNYTWDIISQRFLKVCNLIKE